MLECTEFQVEVEEWRSKNNKNSRILGLLFRTTGKQDGSCREELQMSHLHNPQLSETH